MNDDVSRGLKPKHQRLVLLVIALVALVGAGLLAAWALRNQASYFYVPADIAANPFLAEIVSHQHPDRPDAWAGPPSRAHKPGGKDAAVDLGNQAERAHDLIPRSHPINTSQRHD